MPGLSGGRGDSGGGGGRSSRKRRNLSASPQLRTASTPSATGLTQAALGDSAPWHVEKFIVTEWPRDTPEGRRATVIFQSVEPSSSVNVEAKQTAADGVSAYTSRRGSTPSSSSATWGSGRTRAASATRSGAAAPVRFARHASSHGVDGSAPSTHSPSRENPSKPMRDGHGHSAA